MFRLRKLNDLVVEVIRLRGEVEAQTKIYDLMIEGLKFRIKQLESKLDTIENRQPSSRPLHFSEEEEDLRYAYDTGQIDKDTFDGLMRSVGFANTEVEFAAEDYPRLSLLK